MPSRHSFSIEVKFKVPKFSFSDIKEMASNSVVASKKLFHRTSNAAWVGGISFMVLVLPLIMALDREEKMMNQLESQVSTTTTTTTNI
jgi:hypothetical protein